MASSETCSRCGQEVRWGWRDGREGYWHREHVDHVPIFGHIQTDEERAEIQRQLHLPRTRIVEVKKKVNGVMTVVGTREEVSTTAEMDILKDKDVDRRNRRLAELRGEDPDAPPPPIPEPEIPGHDVTVEDYPPRSGIRTTANMLSKNNWEQISFRARRGPYLGADGSVLSISDITILKARGPVLLDDLLDEVYPVAVASWRDGAFDAGYIGLVKPGNYTVVESVNATELKTWIKENA